jgi:hypothetical protein
MIGGKKGSPMRTCVAVAPPEDRAKNGGTRNHVDHRADDLDDAEPDRNALVIS